MKIQTTRNYDFLNWCQSIYENKKLTVIFFISLLYFILGRIGLLLSIPPTNVSPVWPAAGLALASGLLFGYGVWPAIFAGSFINNFVEFISSNQNTLSASFLSIAIGIGAVLQMFAGVYLVKTFIDDQILFTKAKNIFLFFFFAIITSMINAFIGSLVLYAMNITADEDLLFLFVTWWLGDAGGIFIITPFIYSFATVKRLVWTQQHSTEAFALGFIYLLTLYIISSSLYPLIYLLFPCLIWAAYRFELFGGTVVLILTVIFVISGILNHSISAFNASTVTVSLTLLDIFITVATILTVLLAALLSERAKAMNSLKDYVTNLQDQVRIEESGLRMQASSQDLVAIASTQKEFTTQLHFLAREINQNSKQILVTGNQLAEKVKYSVGIVGKTGEIAHGGIQGLNMMDKTMKNLLSGGENIYQDLIILNGKTDNLNLILSMIIKIVDQANLLSLNSKLEAAKAKEHGKGFAIIAKEISRLSDQTALAGLDIEKLLKAIQDVIKTTLQNIVSLNNQITTSSDTSQSISLQLQEIVKHVDSIKPTFENVNVGMQSQVTEAKNISQNIDKLTSMSSKAKGFFEEFQEKIANLEKVSTEFQSN